MNLTGITEFQEVLVKHFLDSLACVKAVGNWESLLMRSRKNSLQIFMNIL